MKYAYIIDVLRKLKKKYGTLDIYELCERMGILIHYYPMGKGLKSGKGFFTRQAQIKVITVNSVMMRFCFMSPQEKSSAMRLPE